MTRIEEDAFTLDLPGEWRGIGSEPGTLAYHDVDSHAMLVVQPLTVRPLFAIADAERLMQDYAEHRSQYETGQSPLLKHTEPVIAENGGVIEATWDGDDAMFHRRQRHRVLLAKSLLVDFCFSSPDLEADEFDARATEVLAGVALAEPPAGDE